MAAKAFWRRISVHRVNAVLYLVLLALLVLYWGDLRWAAEELPEYLQGDIGSPVERKLYRRAKKIIESGENLEEARPMLERSLSIDPRCEAGFWLAEYYFARGEFDEAATRFASYVEIDPTRINAYRKGAEALETLGRFDEARRMLVAGRDYFRDHVKQFRPRPYRDVRSKFNEKAERVHRYYEKSADKMAVALVEFDQRNRERS